MSIENFSNQESGFNKLVGDKEKEGWFFVGREQLTQTKFSHEAKFEEVPFQTEEDIKNKHLGRFRRQDPRSDFEVELVLDENTDKLKRLREISTDEEYEQIIKNLNPGDRNYFVFIRPIKSS